MEHTIKLNRLNCFLPKRQTLRVALRMWIVFAAMFVLSMSLGCVRAKTVMDLSVPQLSDPHGSKAVKIVKISDLRKFEADPSAWSTPTVARSNEITDRAITVRTIGQGPGKSDLILPEGKTVEMLVGDAVQKALREKGYSVVTDTSPSVTNTIPIEVEIKKFWLWFKPGIWLLTAYYEAEIDLKSPIVLNGNKETVTGRSDINSPLMVSGIFTGALESGLENLINNVKTKLKDQ
jgi:hypothetical protein